jgi:hypothetical protein
MKKIYIIILICVFLLVGATLIFTIITEKLQKTIVDSDMAKQVGKKGEISKCDNMKFEFSNKTAWEENDSLRKDCYIEVAIINDDWTICERLSFGRNRDSCYKTLALEMNKIDICNVIIDGKIKIQCKKDLENNNVISCQTDEDCIIDLTRDPDNPCCWACGYEIINKEMQMKRLKECPLGSNQSCQRQCKAYPRNWVHSKCNNGKCEIYYERPE